MNKPNVRVIDLSHRYSVQWAVRDINLEFTDTGIYGLLGANGAGKSTIMNIMCGVLKPTQGQVLIKDVDLLRNPVLAKKHIGFLPQTPPLQTDLTVEEYLSFCADLRLMAKDEKKAAIEDVMERVQIMHFRRRLIRNLSGGYQQRVGIAQAIIHKPDFVVLDEPTNGLDPNQILEMRKLIKDIAEERAVLLSTHILQEVQALCDNIWMLNEGEMVFSGTIDEFDNYIMPNSLVVSLMSPPAIEDIQNIQGVVQVEPMSGTRFKIQFSDSLGISERIVERSVERGWRLTEINVEKNSLETVFSALTQKKGNK